MTVDVNQIITLLNLIAREELVKQSVKSSFKGSAMAGAGAFSGGLMGGPPGLLIGGFLGTVMGYFTTRDRLISIPEALESLPDHRKERIASHVQDIIDRLEISDVTQLIAIAMTASSVLGSSGTTSTTAAVLANPMLRHIFDNSIEYIRRQIEEENMTT